MSRRIRWFVRAAVLCIGAGTAACASVPETSVRPPAPGAGQALRVMTFNIHHGAGNDDCVTPPAAAGALPNADCGLNLERVAGIIRAAKVDVAGLQEIDRFWARSGGVDQAAVLGAMLGMPSCFGANLTHGADTHAAVPHEYGTLILSRHPIVSCANTLLPRAGSDSEQRGLLKARIDTGAVSFDFYNTHLHTREADRRLQVQAILRQVGAGDRPAVLVGDLNARPTERYLAPLFAALPDTWPVAGSGPGFTSPASLREPARNRIDYVLRSGSITVTRTAVLATPRAALASDHYAVVADLTLTGVRAPSAGGRQFHD